MTSFLPIGQWDTTEFLDRGPPDNKSKDASTAQISAQSDQNSVQNKDMKGTRLNRASSSDAKWQRGLSLPSAPTPDVVDGEPPTVVRQGLEDLWDDVGGQTDITEKRTDMVRIS